MTDEKREKPPPSRVDITDFDLISHEDLRSLLKNKFVVFLGDSNVRSMYKNVVYLLQHDGRVPEDDLKRKGELSYRGDELIEGGVKDGLHNGVNYREVRQYLTGYYFVRYYFITRCYNDYMDEIMNEIVELGIPDVVIMNSTLWDLTRYGSRSKTDYYRNLVHLFQRFKEALPSRCFILWCLCLPVSSTVRGGFLLPELRDLSATLRLDVVEANAFCYHLAVKNNISVIDLHHFFYHHQTHRKKDGIHWDSWAHQHMTNLLLRQVATAFGVQLKGQERMRAIFYPPSAPTTPAKKTPALKLAPAETAPTSTDHRPAVTAPEPTVEQSVTELEKKAKATFWKLFAFENGDRPDSRRADDHARPHGDARKISLEPARSTKAPLRVTIGNRAFQNVTNQADHRPVHGNRQVYMEAERTPYHPVPYPGPPCMPYPPPSDDSYQNPNYQWQPFPNFEHSNAIRNEDRWRQQPYPCGPNQWRQHAPCNDRSNDMLYFGHSVGRFLN